MRAILRVTAIVQIPIVASTTNGKKSDATSLARYPFARSAVPLHPRGR
jgi:hypothetical protein